MLLYCYNGMNNIWPFYSKTELALSSYKTQAGGPQPQGAGYWVAKKQRPVVTPSQISSISKVCIFGTSVILPPQEGFKICSKGEMQVGCELQYCSIVKFREGGECMPKTLPKFTALGRVRWHKI